MTRTASNTDAPLDPPCTREQDEREAREIDEAKAVLFSLRTFRETAESELHYEQLHAALHLALDDGDAICVDRIRRAIWNDHADLLIAAQSQGYQRLHAARRLVQMFQADERQQFPERVRSASFPARTGNGQQDADRHPAAGSISHDTRAAA